MQKKVAVILSGCGVYDGAEIHESVLTLLRQTLSELDHSVLNEIPGLEKPTFEHILLWIESKMKAAGVTPSRLEIERPTLKQRAIYTPR